MLKYLFFLLFISFSGANTLMKSNEAYANFYFENSAENCLQEFSCLNCTTVRVCKRNYYGNLKKVLDFQCSGSTPYCDQDSETCVKYPDVIECNRSTTIRFECSSDGYYPDPTDCHKHFICIKGLAYEMDCKTSFYNPKSQNCNNQNYCNTISCYQKSGIKVVHPSDSAFYGYCYNNTLIAFEKCPGKFEFDDDKQNCVPVCKSEGLQGDPFNCSKYYKCAYAYISTKYTYELQLTHENCYNGQHFDSLNFRCAPLVKGLQCESGLVHIGNRTFVHKNTLNNNNQ